MKCNKTREEMIDIFLDNIGMAYDFSKSDILKEPKEFIWDNAYEITFTRSLYMYLTYMIKSNNSIEIEYLQKKDVFNSLKNLYYDGDYTQDYNGFALMVKDYIEKQKKLEKDEEMS